MALQACYASVVEASPKWSLERPTLLLETGILGVFVAEPEAKACFGEASGLRRRLGLHRYQVGTLLVSELRFWRRRALRPAIEV